MTPLGHRDKIAKTHRSDSPGSFGSDNGYIFSEELPYLKRAKKVSEAKVKREKK